MQWLQFTIQWLLKKKYCELFKVLIILIFFCALADFFTCFSIMILTVVDTNGHPVMGRTANTHHAQCAWPESPVQ